MAAEPAAGGMPEDGRSRSGFSPLLFVGVAIASIGGPLALANMLPGAGGTTASSRQGSSCCWALAVFAAPLTLWLVYSRRVVSPRWTDRVRRRGGGTPRWRWPRAGSGPSPTSSTCRTRSRTSSTTCCRRSFPESRPTAGRSSWIIPVAIVILVLAPRPLAPLVALLVIGPGATRPAARSRRRGCSRTYRPVSRRNRA